MKRKDFALPATALILAVLSLIYFSLQPRWDVGLEKPFSEFSTQRALEQVYEISKKPHYIGSQNHETVAQYIISELRNLGLEVQTQEGYTLSDWGNLTKSKNIMARIKGSRNSKALLLLSHYDSAPHSFSKGASDDASGIATILESVRAFLNNKTSHKNDIIILFTDAEELGLNGAELFVTQNKWAKQVGLALNFEARGTSGPSYMLMEVPKKNSKMVEEFAKASPLHPVTNSLMYSIYKMLPNDTDLTVFREQGKIPGFNFAFIDSHFNYHTAQDDYYHLSSRSLAHQGSYLMPLLNHFANADLSHLESDDDKVYFSLPFYFVSYPFDWNIPLVLIAVAVLGGLLFIGTAKRIIDYKQIKEGFIIFGKALLTSGLATFILWQIILLINPHYKEILQGFPYNGHDYIIAFIFLSLGIGFWFYQNARAENQVANYYFAPLTIWILINLIFVFVLPGAGFMIIPVYFGLMAMTYFTLTQRVNKTLNLFLNIPALLIYAPFVVMFPIGLGLKIVAATAILTILIFGILLSTLSAYRNKRIWAIAMGIISVAFLVKAQIYSGFEKGEAKPNSLVYILDSSQKKAFWTTYDNKLDDWTKSYLGNDPKPATALNSSPLFSKYNNGFTFMADAPLKPLANPTLSMLRDSVGGNQRFVKIKIAPNRNVNRYDLFANQNIVFRNLKANGAGALGQKNSVYERKNKRLLSYYVVNNEPLVLEFSVPINTHVNMTILESSFDLLSQKDFNIKKRESWMMPKPFVLTDAVIIKKYIKI